MIIENKKYIQNYDGSHSIMISVDDEWWCAKDLYQTILDLDNPNCKNKHFMHPESKIIKKLHEEGILFKTEHTSCLMIGDNREKINKFKIELKNIILPILISK